MNPSALSNILLQSFLTSTPDRKYRERREHKIFLALLQSVVGLEERLLTGSEEETGFIAELVSPPLLDPHFRGLNKP